MSNIETFPTPADWQELWDESESDARNPSGKQQEEPRNVWPPIELDWESLED